MISLLPSNQRSLGVAACLLSLSAGVVKAQDSELQEIIQHLQTQNQALQKSLAESNLAEKQATEQLQRTREVMNALGKNLFDGDNSRMVQAAADIQVLQERLTQLEAAANRLLVSVDEYINKALVSDPESRARLEISKRELDSALGFRQKPRPDVQLGTLQQAQVISLDQESGMLVLNLGENQGAKIGMNFRLLRGNQSYATVMLADVRKNICGAFVENPAATQESPRIGDLASVITE